jgi:nucleotide-binding universal stress UspA family protein
MFNEIWVCLDGSALAEKILPLAQSVANASGGTITLLRVVENDRELSAAESYMREQARVCGGTIKFLVSENPASAIVHELETQPRALVAITTHGRTGWAEAILGSVALQVVRDSGRPVLLYRPQTNAEEAPKKIDTLALALDGSEFSERIIHYAADMAKAMSARLVLIQALPLHPSVPGSSDQKSIIPLESSYLRRQAVTIRRVHGIEADWEVLHGDAGTAICRYLDKKPNTMLAMTSHARSGLERSLIGSVAAACIRKAGLPMMIYWPTKRT